MSLLGYERGEAAATMPIRFQGELDRLLLLAKERGVDQDPLIRQRLAWCYEQGPGHALPRDAHADPVPRRAPPGPDGGDHQAVLERVPPGRHRARRRHPRRRGARRRPGAGRRARSRPTTPARPNSSSSWVDTFLNARAGTIYAGSSQIQRNIIGEMVLGLPKEPKARRERDPASRRRRGPPAPAVAGGACASGGARVPRGGGGARRSCRCRPREYLRFRLLTQYGDSERRASAADVVNYLAWCRDWP